MFIKILKMIGATIILLVLVQYLVSALTALFILIFSAFGYNATEDPGLYSTLNAPSIIISFVFIIYLWFKGYRSIFKDEILKGKGLNQSIINNKNK